MEELYNLKKELAHNMLIIGRELDEIIQEKWGFSYSQVDDDESIDTLDYGTSDLDYDSFVKKMDCYKKEIENGNKKLNY